MRKELMLTPGPTSVPARVLERMNRENVHHRSAEFAEVFFRCQQRYQQLVDCNEVPVFLTCSGTGAMEAAMRSLLEKDSKVLVYHAGKFGQRFVELGKTLGHQVIECRAEWGNSPSLDELEKTLTKHSDIKAFAIQYCETSTGVLHPLKDALQLVHKLCPDALTIVDAITALAVVELSQSQLGIDALLCGSQKALMLPAGLAMLSLSSKAWKVAEENSSGSLYFDLTRERKAQAKGSSAWTPAAHLILGFDAALELISEEGLPNIIKRHRRLSLIGQQAIDKLSLKPFVQAQPAPGLSVFYCPEDRKPAEFRKALLEKHSLRIAGGQEQLKEQVLRVGHMGNLGYEDLIDGFVRIATELSRSEEETRALRDTLEKTAVVH